MESYLPIAFLLVIGVVMSVGIWAVTTLLGPKNPTAVKLSPYECGVPLEGNARTPFRSRFYLIAVLFLLFDVEAAFLFPWALIYRESIATQGAAMLFAMLAYLFFVVLGLIFIYRKNCLEMN